MIYDATTAPGCLVYDTATGEKIPRVVSVDDYRKVLVQAQQPLRTDGAGALMVEETSFAKIQVVVNVNRRAKEIYITRAVTPSECPFKPWGYR